MILVYAEWPNFIPEDEYKRSVASGNRMSFHSFRKTRREAEDLYEAYKQKYNIVAMYELVLQKRSDSSVDKLIFSMVPTDNPNEAKIPGWL